MNSLKPSTTPASVLSRFVGIGDNGCVKTTSLDSSGVALARRSLCLDGTIVAEQRLVRTKLDVGR